MRPAICYGIILSAALFAQSANAEPTRLSILGGLITFQMLEGWQNISKPDRDIHIEPAEEGDTYMQCEVRAAPLPPLPPQFHSQSTTNELFKRYYHQTFPDGDQEFTYKRFEEKGGVSISRRGLKYDGMHMEIMQFYIFAGEQAHGIQADCVATPEATPEFLAFASQFLDSMQIAAN